MADSRPTPVSIFQAARLCWQLLFAPQRFIEAEQKDIEARNGYTDRPSPPHRASVVRGAFFKSLALVVVSSAVGFAVGHAMDSMGRCATGETVQWAQIVGASLLLWGTLFVRGWEIQSFSGVLFTEWANQWLYRALYCLGTAVLVFSLAFPACKQ